MLAINSRVQKKTPNLDFKIPHKKCVCIAADQKTIQVREPQQQQFRCGYAILCFYASNIVFFNLLDNWMMILFGSTVDFC